MTQPWPFDQPPDAAALVTRQVLDGELPILRAVHDEDDHSWAFTCGTTTAATDARVVSMAEAVALDGSLRSISDLPPGWRAERDAVGGTWRRRPRRG